MNLKILVVTVVHSIFMSFAPKTFRSCRFYVVCAKNMSFVPGGIDKYLIEV
jgi:hypothetical protein